MKIQMIGTYQFVTSLKHQLIILGFKNQINLGFNKNI